MASDITAWTGLVTSEHSDKPKFMASLSAVLQPLADMRDMLLGLPAAFDVDSAVGAQLDVVGLWVGASRMLPVEITGSYFSFDTDGLGWDQAPWWAPGDPTTTMVSLPDDSFRLLIKAKISANHWDGTIPGAYAAWDKLFAGTGFSVLIDDLGGMHMLNVLTGGTPDVITTALYEGGYLSNTPAAVGSISLIGGVYPPSPGTPLGISIGETALGEV